MKARNIILTIVAAILSANAGAAEKYESTFISYEMALDGDPIDWQGIPIVYLEDSLHVMSIAHDDHDLYLMYRFADERLARQLMMRGVTLWINGNGYRSPKSVASLPKQTHRRTRGSRSASRSAA